MSAAPQEKATAKFTVMPTEKGQERAPAKFIQISSGQPFGQGLTLFALDEAGDVWQIIPGRDPQEWQRLPKKRAGGPGRRASR